MSWYAIFVQNGKEEVVREELLRRCSWVAGQGCVLVPKRKIPEKRDGMMVDVLKIMFPGYIFLKTQMSFSKYYELKEVPGIYRLLNYQSFRNSVFRFSREQEEEEQETFFKEIPVEEMEVILNLLNDEEILDYSDVIVNNSTIKIKSGPLKNIEARIRKIDKHKKRAKIILDLIGKEVMLDVGLEIFYV